MCEPGLLLVLRAPELLPGPGAASGHAMHLQGEACGVGSGPKLLLSPILTLVPSFLLYSRVEDIH